MTEDNSEPKPQASKMSRRDFLGAVGTFFGKTALEKVPHLEARVSTAKQEDEPSRKTIEEIVAEVEAMSLEELEHALYVEYPPVPDIKPIADRINAITDIPEGSTLMKAGTSVAGLQLSSLYGETIDPSEIDLGDEQFKVEKVFSHLNIPHGAMDSATISGVDIPGLFDPMLCRNELCAPGEGVVDAYLSRYEHTKVSINFIGTNLVRQKASLKEFAEFTQFLLDYYVDNNVIPILTTFPHPRNANEEPYKSWFENPAPLEKESLHGRDPEEWMKEEIEQHKLFLPENALKYNVLLLKLAELNQIPIINVQRGIVEMAENNGSLLPTEEILIPEVDPLHLSSSYGGASKALTLPPEGRKFPTAEEAVSYFTVQTLYEILEHQAG